MLHLFLILVVALLHVRKKNVVGVDSVLVSVLGHGPRMFPLPVHDHRRLDILFPELCRPPGAERLECRLGSIRSFAFSHQSFSEADEEVSGVTLPHTIADPESLQVLSYLACRAEVHSCDGA